MMLSRPITLDDQLNAPVDIEPNRTERLLPLEDGVTRRLEPDVPQPPAGGGVSGVRRRRRLVYLLAFGVAALLFSATVPDPGAKVDGRGDRVAGATGKVETAPSENAPAAMPPAADQGIPVTVAQVSRQDVAIYRTGLGSVQAFNTVAVTSRVDGQLESIAFEEGQEVRTGDILAKIDDRLYQAVMRQKEAQLRAATALVNSSRTDLERMATLLNKDVGSRQAYEAQLALVEQNEAQKDAAAADLENAKLQVEYATIRSPIDGRVGFRQIDVGNMIRSIERTAIAIVTQVEPINVVFTLPQEDLLAVGAQLADGKALTVTALARDGRLDLGSGTLSTIDNQVDAATGTFKLKARFENEQKTLWPGEFVTVRLMVERQDDALVVPAQAVQRSQKGAYVYVVSAEHTAEMREIEVGLIQDGLAIIKAGLQDGEQVVVDGQFKLEPGSRIAISPPPAATASEDAAALPPG
jgi:multidrug efflux system membrane fusion protein